MLIGTGISHLTFAKRPFRAQVPASLPMRESKVVAISGVTEILIGASLIGLPERRIALGLGTAAFFVAIFPGNVSQVPLRFDGLRSRYRRQTVRTSVRTAAVRCVGAAEHRRLGVASRSRPTRELSAEAGPAKSKNGLNRRVPSIRQTPGEQECDAENDAARDQRGCRQIARRQSRRSDRQDGVFRERVAAVVATIHRQPQGMREVDGSTPGALCDLFAATESVGDDQGVVRRRSARPAGAPARPLASTGRSVRARSQSCRPFRSIRSRAPGRPASCRARSPPHRPASRRPCDGNGRAASCAAPE